MNGTLSQADSLVTGIKQGATKYKDIDILVCPTFVHLSFVHDLLDGSNVMLGAQNLYLGDSGAFTGEVSGLMLKDIGCDYVLIGHSERRTVFREELALITDKFKAAVAGGIRPILCVGETQSEREEGKTEEVIRQQIGAVLEQVGVEGFHTAVVAYEPVWAIGTGLTASPEQAQEVHAYIRQLFAQNSVDLGNTIRILYGGSMKPDNAAALLAMPDIDGGLIGGAALKADSFMAICAAASQEVETANSR